MSGKLEGRVAVITGAGRGIGAAIARAYAREGADVALIARTEKQLAAVASDVEKAGRKALVLPGSVTDAEGMMDAGKKVMEEWGRVDILVNNAGIIRVGPTVAIQPEQWEQTIEVNLIGAFLVTRAYLAHMLKQGSGCIIMMSSRSGRIGRATFGAYAASKHGMIGFMRSLSNEVKNKGIRVNAICPGFVDTPMVPKSMVPDAMPAEHVADLALYLASDEAQSIMGADIGIYGAEANAESGGRIPMTP